MVDMCPTPFTQHAKKYAIQNTQKRICGIFLGVFMTFSSKQQNNFYDFGGLVRSK